MVACCGRIFAIGGWSGDDGPALNAVERYDPPSNTWTSVASISQRRSGSAAVVMDGKIYVVGGFSSAALSSMEIYDPQANRWTLGPPMKHARGSFGLAVHSGKIYAIAGYNGGFMLESVECFDPRYNSWEFVETTSPKISHFGCSSVQL